MQHHIRNRVLILKEMFTVEKTNTSFGASTATSQNFLAWSAPNQETLWGMSIRQPEKPENSKPHIYELCDQLNTFGTIRKIERISGADVQRISHDKQEKKPHIPECSSTGDGNGVFTPKDFQPGQ